MSVFSTGIYACGQRFDATAPVTGRRFALVGTGHETPEGAATIWGTVQWTGGALIPHVYE